MLIIKEIISKQSYHRYLDFTLDRAERLDLNHDFGHSFPSFLFSSKKKRRRKGKRIAKIVILSHAFLLDSTLASEIQW